MKRLRLVLILFMLFAGFSSSDAYEIRGQIAHYSPRWVPKVYLAIILSVDDFTHTSADMIINEANLDSAGNFVLEGSNLSAQTKFYRLFVTDKDGTASYYADVEHQNFMHLPLNNQSVVNVKVDLAQTPIYKAKITGVHQANQYLEFYQKIYYLGADNFDNQTGAQESLTLGRQTELILQTVQQNANPYYSILALAHLNWPVTRLQEIDDVISELPQNQPYVAELMEKNKIARYQTALFRPLFRDSVFAIIGTILLGLASFVVFLMLKLKKHLQPQDPIQLSGIDLLTAKEREIAQLIAAGHSNKEIASMQFVEVSTIKTHISNIYQKLRINDRRALIRLLSAQNPPGTTS